jgi:hypothetical protein
VPAMATTASIVFTGSATTGASTYPVQWFASTSCSSASIDAVDWDFSANPREITITEGNERTIHLPDGTTIYVDAKGNHRIEDKDARVVYKGNRLREFNRFINASDILEDFIRFAGGLGVRRGELLKIPVEVFIQYLIVRATEQDGEESPDGLTMEAIQKHPALLPPAPTKFLPPRCRNCGRFIRRAAPMPFCGESHLLRFARKVGV